ncbi:MAG: DUF814 domain-containing protein [Archaeoglobi archaeon]|nr:DUF814 domain-containing protein [Candidatus Mnemosynella bozhongmuii]
MKEEMSSVDVYASLRELAELEGAWVDKIYQPTPSELRLKLRALSKGRVDLVLASNRIHITSFPLPAPKTPSNFAMSLRKHLSGGKIRKISQHEFDRIVEITVEREKPFRIISEMFHKGNVILVDEESRIVALMKPVDVSTRTLRRGEIYSYPPETVNPLKLDYETFSEILRSSSSDVVRTIATRLNFGGVYAEEICLRAGVEKNRKMDELREGDFERLFEALKDIFRSIESSPEPQIVMKDGRMIDVTPISLLRYDSFEKKYFSSFQEALDSYFSSIMIEAGLQRAESGRREKLLRQKEQQEKAVEKFEKEIEFYSRLGDWIYENYLEIQEILKRASVGESHPWIRRVDPKEKKVYISAFGREIPLRYDMSVEKNASIFYERVKVAKNKKEGALKALQETLKKLESLREDEEILIPQRAVRKKDRWFYRYRWFISSEGLLAVGGKDADSNEELVKKYMEKNDIFFHADVHGAPAVILKTEGKNFTEKTIFETAVFAVSYSSLWKAGAYSGDCYWVYPDQVSKTPESGEYLPKGAFVIRGERNYIRNVPLKLSIGIEISDETRLMCGPETAVEKWCKYHVSIVPGDVDKNAASRRIHEIFRERCDPEDRRIVKEVASPSEILKVLPPGGVMIVESD